jgi:hypothetical protein
MQNSGLRWVSHPSPDRAFVLVVLVVLVLVLVLILFNDARDARRGFWFDDTTCSNIGSSIGRRLRGWSGCGRRVACWARRGYSLVVNEVVHGWILVQAILVFLFDRVHFVSIDVWNYALCVGPSTAGLAVRDGTSPCICRCIWRHTGLQEAAHHEWALLRRVGAPVFPVAVEVDFFHVHLGIEVFGVELGRLVPVTEAGEAVAPGHLASLVKDKSTLTALAVLQFPRAYRTAIDTVLLVPHDVQWRRVCVLETALEEATGARILIVPVQLHGVGLVLLPLPVVFDGLAWGK